MILDLTTVLMLACAAIPCALFFLNLLVYRRLPSASVSPMALSVLIPARDEEDNIRAALASILANRGVDFEVIVMDDHSTDSTAAIVGEFALRDPRVLLKRASPLPPGWCGKMWACHQLARHARHPALLFLDADVRVAPDALARLSGALANSECAYLSGIPRQEVHTFSERLLIPLIHFVLLGFLPMHWMRRSRNPALSAGCGQVVLVRADAYRAVGGHGSIRATLHDGILLPRRFRGLGFHTGLFDLTDAALCRLYSSNRGTWRGLAKNASEGLGAPRTIVPMSLLLAGGQILPLLLFPFAPMAAACAMALSFLPRLVSIAKFRQPLGSALLHPVGVAALLAIQWFGLVRHLAGRPSQWKGRSYQAAKSARGATWAALLLLSLPTPGQVTNRVCPTVTLLDQSEISHSLSFCGTNLTILAIADKKGHEQMGPWIKILTRDFADKTTVLGVADLSAVPGPLRGFVKRRLQKALDYPVLLDWESALGKPLAAAPLLPNLYLIDTNGAVLLHLSGPPSTNALQQLRGALARRGP